MSIPRSSVLLRCSQNLVQAFRELSPPFRCRRGPARPAQPVVGRGTVLACRSATAASHHAPTPRPRPSGDLCERPPKSFVLRPADKSSGPRRGGRSTDGASLHESLSRRDDLGTSVNQDQDALADDLAAATLAFTNGQRCRRPASRPPRLKKRPAEAGWRPKKALATLQRALFTPSEQRRRTLRIRGGHRDARRRRLPGFGSRRSHAACGTRSALV